MVTWITPTGHNDPGGNWSSETAAYDDDTATQADASIPGTSTGTYLELTHTGVDGDVIRFHLDRQSTAIRVDQVEVKYGGAWHTLATQPTGLSWGAWNEFSLASRQTMTGMRIRFYNSFDLPADAYVNEADFGEVPRKQTSIMGDGKIITIGEGTISIL